MIENSWEAEVRNCHCTGPWCRRDVCINSVTSQESTKWADWSVTGRLNSSPQCLISTVTGSWQQAAVNGNKAVPLLLLSLSVLGIKPGARAEDKTVQVDE